jgi:hypothetical protein
MVHNSNAEQETWNCGSCLSSGCCSLTEVPLGGKSQFLTQSILLLSVYYLVTISVDTQIVLTGMLEAVKQYGRKTSQTPAGEGT